MSHAIAIPKRVEGGPAASYARKRGVERRQFRTQLGVVSIEIERAASWFRVSTFTGPRRSVTFEGVHCDTIREEMINSAIGLMLIDGDIVIGHDPTAGVKL